MTTDGDCTSESPCSPSLGQTHTSIPLTQSYLEALNLISEKYATWHSLLSMHLASFSPPTSDLFPTVSKEFPISSYREWRWQKCVVNTKPTKECLVWQSILTSGMPDVSSWERRADSTGADAWRLFHFYPYLPVPNTGKSWTFLGELDKIVPVSPMRFESIGVISTESKSCLQLNINLDAGETVRVGAVSPSGIYVEKSLIPEGRQER